MSVPGAEIVRRVVLPGGFVDDDGRVHADADLAVLTGVGEAAILNAPPETCAAQLATLLLAHAVRRLGTRRRITEDVVRGLIVQDREFLLIRLRELLLGPDMWVRVDCPRAECGESMEIKLRLDALPVTRRPAVSRYTPFDDEIEFRLPTGGDQEWMVADAGEGSGDGRRLLARCLRRRASHGAVEVSALSEDTIDAIDARMQAMAPDVTPEVDAVCPECRQPFAAEVDLPFLILSEVRHATRRLEEEVHVLAWHYHWSEADILAMSRPKRARYVRHIEEQLERLSPA